MPVTSQRPVPPYRAAVRRALLAAALSAALVAACNTTPAGPTSSGGLIPLDGSFPALGGSGSPGASSPVSPEPVPTASSDAPASLPPASRGPDAARATTLEDLAALVEEIPEYDCLDPQDRDGGQRNMWCFSDETTTASMVVEATESGGAIEEVRFDLLARDGDALDEGDVRITLAWAMTLLTGDVGHEAVGWVIDHAAEANASTSVGDYALEIEVIDEVADASQARRLTIGVTAATASGSFAVSTRELIGVFDDEMDCGPETDDSRIGYRSIECRFDGEDGHRATFSPAWDADGSLASVFAAVLRPDGSKPDETVAAGYLKYVLAQALDGDAELKAVADVTDWLGQRHEGSVAGLVLGVDSLDDGAILLVDLSTPAYLDAPAAP